MPGRCYAPAGGPGPPAEQGYGKGRKRRGVGAPGAVGGRRTPRQGPQAGVGERARFYRLLPGAYPGAGVIYVARGNRPVHPHPRLSAELGGAPMRLPRLPA